MSKSKELNESIQLTSELQAMLHKHGTKKFMLALVRACFNASNDTIELDDRSISDEYYYYADEIDELISNRPTFLGDENE